MTRCFVIGLVIGLLVLTVQVGRADNRRVIPLFTRSSGMLLVKQYPTTNLRIEISVLYQKPGVIIDTVGINGAPIGAFAAMIDGANHVSFNVYDPSRCSEVQVSNGWHLITSTSTVTPGTPFTLRVDITPAGYGLWLNTKKERQIVLSTPLSGQPCYAGDYPGDDSWGPKYNIHPAMIGMLTVHCFGEIPVDTSSTTHTTSTTLTSGIPTPVPTDTFATIDAGVRMIEEAFRSRNLEAVLARVAPGKRDDFRAIFTPHRAELTRVADLLKTRRLASTTGSYAEYLVSDRGKTFPITFTRVDGVWCLMSL